jgi:serine/threonine protein phosphatase 1
MPGRTIAIGDIHGCAAALRAVLQAIDPKPEDTIVTLGDYVDRGPDSRGVIDELLKLEKRCRLVPLMGNHELMLLSALEFPEALASWKECGGKEALKSYGGRIENVPESHLEFIRRCRRYYETATHFFVHANYEADLSLDQQPDYLLFWEHLMLRTPPPHENGKVAIVGHTSQRTGNVLDGEYIICIDTYCHGGGWLTALDVVNGKKWQADLYGRMRGPAK